MVKIIDGNGKLFGKINLIDLMALLFLLSLAPMFFYGYKIFHRKPMVRTEQVVEVKKKESMNVELIFIFRKVDPRVVGLISAGDKVLGENKEIIGEILSLGEVRPYSYEISIGSTKKTIIDSVFKDLPATLKIKAEVNGNNLYYEGKQISDNSAIDFVTDKYKLEAFYVPNLIESNNRVENVSDSIKIIQQKQKEMEYVVSKLQNRVDFLENKIGSVENRIASMAETVVSEETKIRGKNK